MLGEGRGYVLLSSQSCEVDFICFFQIRKLRLKERWHHQGHRWLGAEVGLDLRLLAPRQGVEGHSGQEQGSEASKLCRYRQVMAPS